MWIYTKNGFFSIVQDKDHPKYLWVRSRVKGDLEKQFPGREVLETPDRDYIYRVMVSREGVATTLAENIKHDLDYTNFKNAVDDPVRHDYYLMVWEIMAEMQNTFLEITEGKESQHDDTR